jgi:formylglycine-generating enzyme required for sulfatase activity
MMTPRLPFPTRFCLGCLLRRATVALLLAFALGSTALAQPAVSNVRATARAGTKFVDITYDLAHATGLSSTVRVQVSQDGGAIYGTASSLTGAFGAGIAPGTGKSVAWNAGQDWTAAQFSNVRVRVTADDGQISGGGTPPAGMALIPAGAFVMGDPSSDEGYINERPTRTVTLSAFYLAKTEVTFAEWKEVRDWAVSRGYTDLASIGSGKADTHPVINVSWYDAAQWLNAKSEKEGLTPVYYTNDAQTTIYRTGNVNVTPAQAQWTANGYRLPTEAEWEYAARGGLAGKRFPLGDTITHQQANYQSISSFAYDTSSTRGYHSTYATDAMPYTAPVGSFAANGYGLFDMAGNVIEWCWDVYGTETGTTDPRGPSTVGARDNRGGSWFSEAIYLRTSFRGYSGPSLRNFGLGFRPARSASGTNTVMASSAVFTLDLSIAPTISTPPASQSVITGGTATFTVVASGTVPLTYQWRKDGTSISGATLATLTLSGVQSTNSGSYSAVVSNAIGSVTSSTATLTILSANQAPAFSSNPPAATATVDITYGFTFQASGNPTPTFAVASGALPPGLTLTSSGVLSGTPTQAGTYTGTVKATNGIGTDATQDFSITVAAQPVPPTITLQPTASETVNSGGSVTFFVAATGTPSPTYQWRKDGIAISGEVGAALTLTNVQSASSGSYSVLVSNVAGSVSSSAITLTVTIPPAITTQPASVTVNVGQTASLTVVGTGSPTPAYQWRKSGVNLSAATNATLTIANAQPGDAGSYDVVLSNSGGSATSAAATLSVNGPPSIITPPASVSVTAGQPATLTVAGTGSAPLAYQWRKNGLNLSAATNATLTIANAQPSDAGSYDAVLSNPAGTIISGTATLTVNIPPAISTPPASVTVIAGQTATLTATGTGTPTPTYQWRKNGLNLTAATNATLAIANAQPSDAGSYDVVLSNAAGTFISAVATVTVNIPPTITAQPASVTVNAGQPATLTVTGTGSSPLTYQWRKNGLNLSAATNATLTIANVQPGDAGSYDVVLRNAAGTLISGTATLTVSGQPVIAAQPTNQTVTAGNSVTISVTATSTLAPSFQWQRNGVNIPGATSTSLSILSAKVDDAGSYACVVTNAAGSVTSRAAVLAVNPANPSRLINVSILTSIDSAGDSFTMGYVVGGSGTTGAKPLVVRAAGPSLGALGVPGTIDDPKVEFFAGATKTGENDNWGGSSSLANAMANVGAFPFTGPASRDAASAFSVTTSDNSVKVSATGSGTGAVIAEIYEANPAGSFALTDPRLVNISVLKPLGTGFTVGFVVGGGGGKTVLIRAIGPTLGTAFNLQGAAADPQLKLFSGQTQIGGNDNWGGTADLTAAFTAVGAFMLPATSRDAALVTTLQPGNYTAQASGVDGTTGVAIVEVYEVP